MSETIQTPRALHVVRKLAESPYGNPVEKVAMKSVINDHARLLAENAEYKAEVERLRGAVLRDWAEDFADEDNGHYQHVCDECKQLFSGHKRRVSIICKECWIKFATKVVIHHNRAALKEKA